MLYAALPPRDGYLARALGEAGHTVESAADLTDLLFRIGGDYDAVLIDGGEPDLALLRRIARAAGRTSLLVVVDEAGAVERTRMLQAGADACFVRPVQFMELEARLSALIRLAYREAGDGDETLVLDQASRTARLGVRQVILPIREFALLEHLLARAGEVLGPDQILDHVWGETAEVGPERLRSTIARLRGRLTAALGAPLVETVRGHGYRLEPKMKLSSSS